MNEMEESAQRFIEESIKSMFFRGGICGNKNKAFYTFGLCKNKMMILDPHFVKDQTHMHSFEVDYFDLLDIGKAHNNVTLSYFLESEDDFKRFEGFCRENSERMFFEEGNGNRIIFQRRSLKKSSNVQSQKKHFQRRGDFKKLLSLAQKKKLEQKFKQDQEGQIEREAEESFACI